MDDVGVGEEDVFEHDGSGLGEGRERALGCFEVPEPAEDGALEPPHRLAAAFGLLLSRNTGRFKAPRCLVLRYIRAPTRRCLVLNTVSTPALRWLVIPLAHRRRNLITC